MINSGSARDFRNPSYQGARAGAVALGLVIAVCLMATMTAAAGPVDSTATAREPVISGLEVLEKVDRFYAGAWERLTIYVTVVLAVAGILVPLAVNVWQRQQLRRDEAGLRDEIAKHMAALKSELEATIEARLASMREEHQAMINSATAILTEKQYNTTAGVLMVQAGFAKQTRNYTTAVWSTARSIQAALKSKDNALVQQCVRNLIEMLNAPETAQAKRDAYTRQSIIEALAALRDPREEGRYVGLADAIQAEAAISAGTGVASESQPGSGA